MNRCSFFNAKIFIFFMNSVTDSPGKILSVICVRCTSKVTGIAVNPWRLGRKLNPEVSLKLRIQPHILQENQTPPNTCENKAADVCKTFRWKETCGSKYVQKWLTSFSLLCDLSHRIAYVAVISQLFLGKKKLLTQVPPLPHVCTVHHIL